MMELLKLPRLGSAWQDNPSYFARIWNLAMQTIEDAVNAINQVFQAAQDAQTTADGAQTSANGAQSTADGAQTTATAAQTTASNALVLAGTSVQKDQTTAWAAPLGAISRAALAGYTAPTISNPPTQAEVQAIANYLQILSQIDCGLITDLRIIHALHN